MGSCELSYLWPLWTYCSGQAVWKGRYWILLVVAQISTCHFTTSPGGLCQQLHLLRRAWHLRESPTLLSGRICHRCQEFHMYKAFCKMIRYLSYVTFQVRVYRRDQRWREEPEFTRCQIAVGLQRALHHLIYINRSKTTLNLNPWHQHPTSESLKFCLIMMCGKSTVKI